MRTADKFTLVRIILAPVFFILYFIPEWFGVGQAISVFIMVPLLAFAEFTDFLDGYFARKNNAVSDFGKLFDPFADVFLHLTTFFCFVLSGYLPPIVFLLIFYREVTMNFIRLIAAKQGVAIAARRGGKLKTVLYVVTGFYYLVLESIGRLGLCDVRADSAVGAVGAVLAVLCLVGAYASLGDYVRHFAGGLGGGGKKVKKK